MKPAFDRHKNAIVLFMTKVVKEARDLEFDWDEDDHDGDELGDSGIDFDQYLQEDVWKRTVKTKTKDAHGTVIRLFQARDLPGAVCVTEWNVAGGTEIRVTLAAKDDDWEMQFCDRIRRAATTIIRKIPIVPGQPGGPTLPKPIDYTPVETPKPEAFGDWA